MNTVAVRPRLDRRYDVLQSATPQLVGSRDTRADALALATWAAGRIPPCTITVFAADGATVEETRVVEGTPRARAATSH